MREIKFRAWDIENKRWADESDFCGVSPEGEILVEDGNDYPHEVVLSQFTGLKDKNGKEIYEGDVVTCQGGYDYAENQTPDCEEPAKVVFDNGKWMLECETDSHGELYEYDIDAVIGNIYENPELLSPEHE